MVVNLNIKMRGEEGGLCKMLNWIEKFSRKNKIMPDSIAMIIRGILKLL